VLPPRPSSRAALVVLALLALSLIASFASAQGEKYPTAPTLAPPVLLRPGKLLVVTDATLPPLQQIDERGEFQGMRIELGNEIARRLGLPVDWIDAPPEAHVTGLLGRRWDLVLSGLLFTPERARLMYLIPDELRAVAISVPKGNPKKVTGLLDLAGRPVAVEGGGYEERQIRNLSANQATARIKPMDIRTFGSVAEAYRALGAEKVEAVASEDAVAKQYETAGNTERVLFHLAASPVAIAIRSKELAGAVLRVMNQMKADGTYAAILDRYGVATRVGVTFELKGPDTP
jgi:polar amino acid transport system substrate-binding protein